MTGRPDGVPFLIDGPSVVVPARVAAWLGRHGLDALRVNARGSDREVDDVLLALHHAALLWRTSAAAEAGAEAARPDAEVAPLSEWMTTTQAADRLGLTARAVRLALTSGRLPGQQHDGVWRIKRDDLEHYRAARAA